MAARAADSGDYGRVRGESGDIVTSVLGTKNHWEDVYEKELTNFREHGDEGEVWFGYPVVRKMVSWLEDTPRCGTDSRIVEVGCGNGTLLTALAEEGFTDLVGTDYSEAAVELAREVAAAEGAGITVHVRDLLDEAAHADLGLFDVVLDKGTYDAVTLNPDSSTAADPSGAYIASVARMVKEGGLFMITSCNYTEEELKRLFGDVFEVVDVLEFPRFQFAGGEGQTVSSVVFSRRAGESAPGEEPACSSD